MRKQREVRENELDEARWHKFVIWHLSPIMSNANDRPNELESLLCNIDWGNGVAARQTRGTPAKPEMEGGVSTPNCNPW